MAIPDDIEKLAKNQAMLQKNFTFLKSRVDELSKRVAAIEGEPSPELYEAPVAQAKAGKAAKAEPSKETAKPIENLGFKVFGAVGFLLILLGLFYLYRYAVDNGWIGITGRVALGVIFSMLIILGGEYARRKAYPKFSAMLVGGGLALLYFTFYATYLFRAYRDELGMTPAMNLILLFVVMLIAVVLALRQDSVILTVYAFLLGYLAPLLVGAVQPTGNYHVAMLATLFLSAGLAVILWKKNWKLGVYPLVASYLVYMVLFFQQHVMRSGYYDYATRSYVTGEIPAVVGPFLAYLIAFFLMFNVLAILLKDEKGSIQNVMIAVLNACAFLAFGLTMVWRYWEEFRGVFLIVIAAFFLGMTWAARERDQRIMFETFFLLCISFVTIAIPVQLDKSWVALAWAVEGLLLVRSGLNVGVRGIRVLGYIALGLAYYDALFWGSFELDFGQRTVGYLAVIAAFYGSVWLLTQEKEQTDAIKVMRGLLGILASVLLVVALAVEILDSDGMFAALSDNSRLILVSIVWALLAVLFIVQGFMWRTAYLRVLGLVLFGVTVIKILFVDLGDVSTLMRTVVTIIVGLIALGAAFTYVKNKERIEAMLGK